MIFFEEVFRDKTEGALFIYSILQIIINLCHCLLLFLYVFPNYHLIKIFKAGYLLFYSTLLKHVLALFSKLCFNWLCLTSTGLSLLIAVILQARFSSVNQMCFLSFLCESCSCRAKPSFHTANERF